MLLRHTILPAWYSIVFLSLLTAYDLMGTHPDLAVTIWLGALLFGAAALFALEIIGAAIFSSGLEGEEALFLKKQASKLAGPGGYSRAERLRLLGEAGFCWLFCGLGTVILFQHIGAQLSSRAELLVNASRIVAMSNPLLRIAAAFLLLDFCSYVRHRAEHAGGETGLLWRLVHYRHHRPDEINLWTGGVVHAAESLLVFALPSLMFGAFGLQRWEGLFLFSLFLMITMPQHMNSGWTSGVFGVVIHGPEAHSRHHSIDSELRLRNFADCLTLWDRVFGTFAEVDSRVFYGRVGVSRHGFLPEHPQQ